MHMAGALDHVFNPDVIARLEKQRAPSASLTRRIEILTAVETPHADLATRSWNRILCAHKAAWDDYVSAIDREGFLDEDVRARLTGVDDDGFRSALAECLTCHILARVLRLPVFGRHEGRPGTALDFGIRHDGGDISVEVKSPYAEKPAGGYWAGDHSHILQPVLNEANKQFAEARRNVLALVPLVEFPVLNGRMPFVKAFFGERKVVFTIDRRTGKTIDEPTWQFITEGKFLKLWPEPRFTRTGTVLVIREHLVERNPFEENFEAHVKLRWFLLHNPHCPTPVPTNIWDECAQLVRDGDVIRWTDGGPVDGSPLPHG